jgi:acyl-homoserine-lactone acylase
VRADDLPGVFFGQGWASAEDHACDLADQIMKVKGEKAKWLGAGDGNKWVNSDFAWRAIGIDAIARKEWATQPTTVTAQFDAFAAGWSASVAKNGATGWCKGAPWVQPVTGVDV